MRRRRFGAFAFAALTAFAPFSAAAAGLEPYQMIRSLQILQDRVADGDHAAMPMQRTLLETVDQRLRSAEPEYYQDARNFNALLVYGASGGNPRTLEMVIAGLDLDGSRRELAEGILHYARGDLGSAREMLLNIDPLELDSTVAAPFALIGGSLLARDDPAGALRLLDQARLLSPGTLVEESALRRSIAISARMGDPERFGLAALQYVRRFLRSPYASQFAEEFVAAVIAMHEKIEFGLIERVAEMMSSEQARFIYLRIARQSAIEGHSELLSFASANAEEYAAETPQSADDPRAMLYANIASVTSANVADVRETLGSIDAGRLSAHDRELLEAARQIAGSIVTPPDPRPTLPEETPARDGQDPATSTAAESTSDNGTFDNEAFMAEARSRLEAVDALLKEEER